MVTELGERRLVRMIIYKNNRQFNACAVYPTGARCHLGPIQRMNRTRVNLNVVRG